MASFCYFSADSRACSCASRALISSLRRLCWNYHSYWLRARVLLLCLTCASNSLCRLSISISLRCSCNSRVCSVAASSSHCLRMSRRRSSNYTSLLRHCEANSFYIFPNYNSLLAFYFYQARRYCSNSSNWELICYSRFRNWASRYSARLRHSEACSSRDCSLSYAEVVCRCAAYLSWDSYSSCCIEVRSLRFNSNYISCNLSCNSASRALAYRFSYKTRRSSYACRACISNCNLWLCSSAALHLARMARYFDSASDSVARNRSCASRVRRASSY